MKSARDHLQTAFVEPPPVLRRDMVHIQHRLAADRLASGGERLLVSPVAAEEPSCRVFDNEWVRDAVHQRGQNRRTVGHVGFGCLAFGEVANDGANKELLRPADRVQADLRREFASVLLSRGQLQTRPHPARLRSLSVLLGMRRLSRGAVLWD